MLKRSFTFGYSQRGVTLIELLVGVAVGLLILAGAVTVFAKISFSGLENTRAMRLNQQLRSTMEFIHRDLQRAGYVHAWDETVLNSWADADTDAITASIGAFGVTDLGGANADSDGDGHLEYACIAYSYDEFNENGIQEDPEELFGFRFNGGAVESGTGVTGCDDGSGTWRDISDASVTITALSFEREEYDPLTDEGDSTVYEIVEGGPVEEAGCGAGDICIDRRKINVVLEGQLTSDANVTVMLRDEVKIKNDRYYLVPE